jgi:hypothetical protein
MDWQPEWLLKAEIKGVVTLLLLGLMSGGGWLISRRWAKSGVVAIGEAEGHTTTAASVWVLSAICALFALSIFLIGILDGIDASVPNNRLAWSLLVIGFAAGALLLALMTGLRWTWNAQGISYRGLWGVRSMFWTDLVRFVCRAEGASFVVDRTGRKISWTKYTMHPEALAAAVGKYRPDLAVS